VGGVQREGKRADAREQLRESRQEKARLLALLETEQQARRDLETKLLPSPRPTGRVRPWVLLALLLALLAFAGWNFRAVIVPALHL
jgi:cytochrome c-type biogenesis protein CcmH/NrfG